MSDIIPTHSCFDDAFDFFDRCLLRGDHPRAHELLRVFEERYRVVHGECVGHDDGKPFAHGWVETVGAAWQAGTLDGRLVFYALPRRDFYIMWQVARVWRYTLRQASQLNASSGHLGPWAHELVELCLRTPGGRIVGKVQGAAPLFTVPADELADVVGGGELEIEAKLETFLEQVVAHYNAPASDDELVVTPPAYPPAVELVIHYDAAVSDDEESKA